MEAFRKSRRAAVMIACLWLAGCTTQLYDNLSEGEANAIVAALMENGMRAEKRSGTEETYSVFIAPDDFARAMRALESRALPGRRFDDLGRVFGKDAMFSTPMEEKARYLHAMQEELAHTVSLIDGVLAARVHLVLPEQDQLGRALQSPTAGVFVRHADDERHDPVMHSSEIRRLVAAGVPNLSPDDIVVSFFSAELFPLAEPPPPPPAWVDFLGARVAIDSVGRMRILLIAGALICLVLAGGAFLLGKRAAARPKGHSK